MAHDFEIVWFTGEHTEEAMHSLRLLPETEFKDRRGKAHPFRLWNGSFAPDAEGNLTKKMRCVCVDYPGSPLLKPGEISGKHVCVADHCREIIVIKPGLVGAYIKPEFWEREDVKAEAAAQEKQEQAGREAGERQRQEYAENFAKTRAASIRRYFMAQACGRRLSWRTPLSALQDIALMDRIEEEVEREISLDDWLAVIHPGDAIPEAKPYDRMTFLRDVGSMKAQCVRTHNIQGNAGKYLDRLTRAS